MEFDILCLSGWRCLTEPSLTSMIPWNELLSIRISVLLNIWMITIHMTSIGYIGIRCVFRIYLKGLEVEMPNGSLTNVNFLQTSNYLCHQHRKSAGKTWWDIYLYEGASRLVLIFNERAAEDWAWVFQWRKDPSCGVVRVQCEALCLSVFNCLHHAALAWLKDCLLWMVLHTNVFVLLKHFLYLLLLIPNLCKFTCNFVQAIEIRSGMW